MDLRNSAVHSEHEIREILQIGKKCVFILGKNNADKLNNVLAKDDQSIYLSAIKILKRKDGRIFLRLFVDQAMTDSRH